MTAGVLLLAAGKSRRYGSDKRLAKMVDGRRLLDISISTAINAGLPLLVCLGQTDDTLEADLGSRHIPCVRCANAASGMGSTLAEAMASTPDYWTAVIIGLADMPLIQAQTYKLVATALTPGKIVTPAYRGQRGHPVGLDQAYFPALKALSGDQGARNLLQANPEAVVSVEVNDPGVVQDIDRPEQLAALHG